MSITTGSSLPYIAEIETLSPGAQAYLYGDYDELHWRRSLDFAASERMRNKRTTKLEAKIEQAIADIAAPLNTLHKAFWTSKITQHFENKGVAVPDRDVITRVVDNYDINRLGVLTKNGNL